MVDDQKLRTKIVWSLDRSSFTEAQGKKFADAGFDALRLIYGPGNASALEDFLRGLNSSTAKSSALMVDVSLHKQSNITSHRENAELSYNETIVLSPQSGHGDIAIESPDWERLFVADAMIYIGFGAVVLKTLSVSASEVRACVVQGGSIKVGLSVFVEETQKEPTVFDLSGVDISPFKNVAVDYVVIPGISTPREVAVVRKKLNLALKYDPALIVRVDNKRIYEQLEQILPHVDGIMIPRRELALSLDPALVPMVCKEIIQACHEWAKIAMIESDLLGSMRYNPTPTRAEVSDLANAVIDGTDAIVLAEELALGPHVERALKTCRNVIGDVERQENMNVNWMPRVRPIENEFEAVAYHAYKTAERVKAKAIVCITHQGNTALQLASYRIQFPIIAVTFKDQTRRRLALVRGVNSLVLEINPALDEVLPVVKERLRSYPWLEAGDSIVFLTVSLSPVGHEASNLLTVQKIGEQ